MLRQPQLRCVLLGLLVTFAQVALAVGLAPAGGSVRDRYLSLVQHDSYWFANIIDRGYGTTIPPADHKAMEISNVAFFPGYPVLAGMVKRVTGLGTYPALLVTAQLATAGFWTYFFLFGARWGLPLALQVFGALAIAAHPAAFFLVAGYSESLFLMSLAGFIYWCTSGERGAGWLAVLHGVVMSATRIVGLPCALFPLVHTVVSRIGMRLPVMESFRKLRGPALVAGLSMLGGVAFFAYCQVRWGRWDLYMLTQESGWAIDPDYFAILQPRNYRFAIPPLEDPTRASQFTSALAGVLFVVVALAECVAALRGRSEWRKRVGFYFAALVIYYISLAGVASVQMESMLRYDLCVHALIVLGALHFLREVRFPQFYARASAMAFAAVLCAAGLALQGFYVWKFTQGGWIA